ncbi:MAG: hypothetical protein K2X81_09770, partial [Candidatus Obscuribacterales bacterium]|nr:hypothetical protein [Candidatus Obscuribacterales bacterium]
MEIITFSTDFINGFMSALFTVFAGAFAYKTKLLPSIAGRIQKLVWRRNLTPAKLERQQRKLQEQSARRARFLGETSSYMQEFNCKFYAPHNHSYLVETIPKEDITEVQNNIDKSEQYWQEANFGKSVTYAEFAAQSAAYLLSQVNMAMTPPPNNFS